MEAGKTRWKQTMHYHSVHSVATGTSLPPCLLSFLPSFLTSFVPPSILLSFFPYFFLTYSLSSLLYFFLFLPSFIFLSNYLYLYVFFLFIIHLMFYMHVCLHIRRGYWIQLQIVLNSRPLEISALNH